MGLVGALLQILEKYYVLLLFKKNLEEEAET